MYGQPEIFEPVVSDKHAKKDKKKKSKKSKASDKEEKANEYVFSYDELYPERT